MIRLTKPSIDEADLEAVREVLISGQLVQGKRVAEFENAVATYVRSEHAVAVTNCTAALHMSLLALGVQQGDLVIVAAYSWPASANVIELCGARPVFADIDAETFNLHPDALEDVLRRISRTPGTAGRLKAIIPVHTFGQIADMPAISAVAHHYGVPVVEDAACALGASTGGRPAGTWGAIGCYSFHPRKAVTTGEGGVIVTSDDRIASRLRALRNHGQDPESIAPEFIMPGFNNRMTEFQGALGVTQMAKIDRVIAARRALAGQYDTLLDPALARCGARPNDERHVFQSYVVLLPEAARQVRAEYIKVLRTRGIEAQIGTWHMPLIQYYRKRYNYSRGDFPVCDAISECAVSLPLYEGLREEDQRIVAIETRAALDAVLSD